MLVRDEFFAAVARPPFAPAVRTDIVPRPDLCVVLEVRPFAAAAAVARPPFAPAARFCATVPARPPFAPASATVIARLLDARGPELREVDALRVDVLRDDVLRDDVLREAVPPLLRDDVLREVEPLPLLRDDVLRGDALRELVPAPLLREDELREVVPLPPLLRDAVPRELVPPLRGELLRADELLLALRERDDDPLPDDRLDEPPLDDERDDEPEDDFASPFDARVLLTVRAAISFARFSDRPCFSSDSFTCSYCRSRFALHDWGIRAHLLGWCLTGQRCPVGRQLPDGCLLRVYLPENAKRYASGARR